MPVFDEIRNAFRPVKLWVPASEVEPGALRQIENTANLPFVFRHVAVLPDVHGGVGATVGTVVATKGALVPAAVGVDIGCGMMAVRTALDPGPVREMAGRIRGGIEAAVPLGFRGNDEITSSVSSWKGWRRPPESPCLDRALRRKAECQMGSLGGGNHFIEVCLDEEDSVWVMLHSGSRNVGKTLAERHIHEAKRLRALAGDRLPDPAHSWLEEGTAEFAAYLKDLAWCQDYALQNRVEMMDRVLGVLARVLGDEGALKRTLEVNCHHNYAAPEVHFQERVWVTRKGAVRARRGELGIIPGSMGTRSYIVRGRGSPDSYDSCSHGAGRRMSRHEARKRFEPKDLVDQTAGVECRKDAGVLDEIPGAYKDIDTVMARQEDLVEVVAVLRQAVCVKG
jgi:tRNA-splicing ligase RtcB